MVFFARGRDLGFQLKGEAFKDLQALIYKVCTGFAGVLTTCHFGIETGNPKVVSVPSCD